MKDYTRRVVDEKTVNTVKNLHKEATGAREVTDQKTANTLKNLRKKVMNEMITRQFSEIEKVQSEIINRLNKSNDTLKKDLDLEMRCKNQAYYFILNNGYFEDFREYSKKNAI
jgi:hypothetical protein